MSIEAMKQALEFVASISPAFICEATHHTKKERHDAFKPCPHVERHNRVFEFLRQAIEQAEKQDVELCSTESKETFDQPVAWRHEQFYEGASGWFYADWNPEGLNPPSAQLLYATPHLNHEWVGLDETDLASVSGVEVEWARHWEKVLKGKNT